MQRIELARVLCSALALGLAACGGLSETDIVLARDRAADFGARDDFINAALVLRPLVERSDAPLEDLLRAANAELGVAPGTDEAPTARVERALPLMERAAKLAPDDPVLLWCRYHVASIRHELPEQPEDEQPSSRNDERIALLRRIVALRPEVFTAKLSLAARLAEFENEPDAGKESEALYRELLRIPAEITGLWRVQIVYPLAQILSRQGKDEEAKPLYEETNRLNEIVKAVSYKDVFHSPGTLGVIPPHTPTLFERPRPAAEARSLSEESVALQEKPLGCAALVASWETGSHDVRPPAEEEYEFQPGATLAVWGAGGVALVRGPGAPRRLDARAVVDLVAFDRMNHGCDKSIDPEDQRRRGDRDLDLVVAVTEGTSSQLYLLENVGGNWTSLAEPLASVPALAGTIGGPRRLTPVDYDHDGDLDLLVTTAEGPHLLRNDGFSPLIIQKLDPEKKGHFTDATAEAGLPSGDFLATTEDMDNDGDVDLLWIERGSGAVRLSSNERGGRFSDQTASLPAGLHGAYVVAADLDGDSWVDLALFEEDLRIYMRTAVGGWRSESRRLALPAAPTGQPLAVDWDLDGSFDLVWPCAEAPAAGLLAPAFARGGVPVALGARFDSAVTGPASLACTDLDGDHDWDLVRVDAAGLRTYTTAGTGNGTHLVFQGYKDNARGVGSIVELRSGLLYRRLYFRGDTELVGFGGAPLDVVRSTWPNGIVQGNFELPLGAGRLIAQRPGLGGSCPFLYTWNGRTYEFVTDVLGITPLGLPMAPGMLVPPDHDEFVLVKGEQLVPKDGVYELQFTEELREVTYLDRLRLDVVDHPADTEIFPNERFSFPPFPAAHTHTVKDPLSPLRVTDQDGKDWTRELARNDKSFAFPFEALPGPLQGLSTPYTLELAFDKQRVQSATKLRLFLNGWFYWTDASVNMAAARDPVAEFIPPILSVPDGNGGWKECGDIGFPAGKLKTMEFDVSELLNRDDPRIRLFSTLRLYWDSIRLAVDADDAPMATTAIEPSSAKLWERGFSRSHALLGAHDCEWFTWDELETEPRWNQHPGMYTKLGETVPLLADIDDRFVILGAGDALTVHFDATRAPPLKPGWRRDFLVFLDGWAKDRDPNTIEALYVEPLPFHGMSGYPYRPDEHYPDDEAHRAYRREWNTRPARLWIPSLVPPRFEEPRSNATSRMPASNASAAPTTGSVIPSPSTSTPDAPATRG